MGKTKRVADGEETTVAIPAIVIPVQIEVTLGVVLVKVRNVAIAIAVHPDGNVQNIVHTTAS